MLVGKGFAAILGTFFYRGNFSGNAELHLRRLADAGNRRKAPVFMAFLRWRRWRWIDVNASCTQVA